MRIDRRLRATIVASSLLVFAFDLALSAQPQSLGEVARRESERRREAATGPGRTYTNEDLAVTAPPPAPVNETVPALPPTQETATATADTGSETEQSKIARTFKPSKSKAQDETYWRLWAKQVRERLANASADLKAAQSSLSALDSGPKTSAAARERAVVAAAVQRLESNVRSRQLEDRNLRTQAEINKIPAEWIQ